MLQEDPPPRGRTAPTPSQPFQARLEWETEPYHVGPEMWEHMSDEEAKRRQSLRAITPTQPENESAEETSVAQSGQTCPTQEARAR